MLELQSITVDRGAFHLGPVSLIVPTGSHTLLVGPTGSGKTTLLEIIAGLKRPISGRIRHNKIDITDWPPGDRGLGYAPQDAAVFPAMTVRHNLGFGLAVRHSPKAEQNSRVAELAEKLGLSAILDRRAVGLSGGESQRLALGRALAFRPKLLLLDEPMSALDDEWKARVMDLLRVETTTILHVTHDRDRAVDLADSVLEMDGIRE